MKSDDAILYGALAIIAYLVWKMVNNTASGAIASTSSGSVSIGPIGETLNADGTPFLTSSGTVAQPTNSWGVQSGTGW